MANFEFNEEQIITLKRAILHELHDNSYCMGLAGERTKKQLLNNRKTLHQIQVILNRRQIPSVNEVESFADNE